MFETITFLCNCGLYNVCVTFPIIFSILQYFHYKVLQKILQDPFLRFVKEGNKFAKAGGRHLVNVSQKPNMAGLEVSVVFYVDFQHDIYPQVAQAL